MPPQTTTTKRLLREASLCATTHSNDYYAAPVSDSNLHEWHFTLRGPDDTPYANGLYHGRITLPSSYPLKPPTFRFLTPSGRFEQNKEICLSISNFHEESWNPAWDVRTALTALRPFMAAEPAGQVGGVRASSEIRRRMAGESRKWKCSECGGKTMEEIMEEKEADTGEKEIKETKTDDAGLPALKFGYREELGAPAAPAASPSPAQRVTPSPASQSSTQSSVHRSTSRPVQDSAQRSVWLDGAIAFVAFAIVILLLRRLAVILD
jgi:ubiquitin-conjugating enzyme E2 J1